METQIIVTNNLSKKENYNSEYLVIDDLGYLKKNIILIESDYKKINILKEAFEEINKSDVIGLDSEWVKGKGQIKTIVFQIATREKAYVIDFQPKSQIEIGNKKEKLITHCGDNSFNFTFEELLKDTFTNEKILKIAWDFDLDLKNLNNKFPKNKKVTELLNFVDLMRVSPKFIEKGFSNHCLFYIGKKLDKACQVCEWDKRPLTDDKIIYAAMDAIATISLYDKMRESINIKPFTLNIDDVNNRMLEFYLKKKQIFKFEKNDFLDI